MSSMPRHRLTGPIAAIGVIAVGIFAYGQKSLVGGQGQPSKGNPITSSSMKNSPPEGRDTSSSPSASDDKSHSKIVSQGVQQTGKNGKEAFQEAVKGTRSGIDGKDGSDLETQIANRTPSKERVARSGN